jgi:hypothetical protein
MGISRARGKKNSEHVLAGRAILERKEQQSGNVKCLFVTQRTTDDTERTEKRKTNHG